MCYTFRVFAAPQVRLLFVEAANSVLYAHGCLLNYGRASGIGLMPLSTPVSRRALRHSRVIDVQAYLRDDGLWDIDARITDIKSYDAMLASGKREDILTVRDKVLAAVDAERCTALYGVPTMFLAELEHKLFHRFDMSTLRTGIMAGSICPEPLMRRVIDDMNMKEITICYGLTEGSPVMTQSASLSYGIKFIGKRRKPKALDTRELSY